MTGACGRTYRVDPRLDPQTCNALTSSDAGLLVPEVEITGSDAVPPGNGSTEVQVTVVHTPGCPEQFQVTAQQPATFGQVTQPGGTVDLNTVGSGVPVDVTGTDILLPVAGTYRLDANVRGALNAPAPNNTYIQAWLYNVTAAADVPFTSRIINQVAINDPDTAGSATNNTTPITRFYTVTGPTTIRIRAARVGVANQALIASNANGWTSLAFQKVSD